MPPSDLIRSGRTALVGLGFAVLLAGMLAASGAASTTILPLGDSVTHGSVDEQAGTFHLSYRYWLRNSLRAEGNDVDFVGSLRTPNFTIAFDNDNDGHAGYTSGEILEALPAWLTSCEPPRAIALVHLGTNDVMAGLPPSETVQNLRGIVNLLRAWPS